MEGVCYFKKRSKFLIKGNGVLKRLMFFLTPEVQRVAGSS